MNPSSALDSLIASPPYSSVRYVARVIMVLLALFLLWANLAKLQETAEAPGEIVPQEQIQSIQHLEGGIIEKIDVTEGDLVKTGQPLIQLNVSAFVANKEEAKINLESLLLKRERLTAEAQGQDFTPSEQTQQFKPELVHAETQVFAARRQELASRLHVLQDQLVQKKLDISQLTTERGSVAKNLGLLQQKLAISNDLMKDNLTSKLDHLQLQSEAQELSGRLSLIGVAIPRAESARAEAEEKFRNELLVFRNNALDEMTKLEADIAKNQELLTRATDQVTRTTITSPIDGVVKSLKTHTIGGVVQPGETIMEIVPTSKNLIVEAHLNPRDIGFVKAGQDALVKIQTYDYARYGGLSGKVISLSADSHTDPQTHETYFLVKVRTDKNFLGDNAASFPITAGMQATAEIKTGSKTVLQYLLKPIIKVSEESFHER